MLVGAQVSAAGGILKALPRADEMRADVIQIFGLNPRTWRAVLPSEEITTSYREAEGASRVAATFCHAPYLINLGTEDKELGEKSFDCLADNLLVGTAIGSGGVVLHAGSHLGRGTAAVLHSLARSLRSAMDQVSELRGEPCCPLLLENTAGAGGTIGRSFEELGEILDAADGDERLGICLDTQHLFASGVPFSTLDEADDAVASLDQSVGLDRLRLIHLNDSKVEFGANRDRHENLGAGRIGRGPLGLLCSHPGIIDVPITLEVPGTGDGPRKEDVADARRIISNGLRRRKAAI